MESCKVQGTRPIFKIGDKVVGKRDKLVQVVTQISEADFEVCDEWIYTYNGKYWGDELRYATDEEVGKYFQ